MPVSETTRKEYQRAWYVKNKDRLRSVRAAYRAAHRDEIRGWQADYRATNAERINAQTKAWREAHPEAKKVWDQENGHLHCANVARRKAQKTKATPAWANDFFIREVYHLAKLRSAITGFPWHVDHIVPLRSKRVCGLHVENNLQIIPAQSNALKSNRHWPDMAVTSAEHSATRSDPCQK